MNKPSQLHITTPNPDFRCSTKTAPSTFTLKTEASGGDQTCLHCFAEPNAVLPEIADVAETAFAEFDESPELGEVEELDTALPEIADVAAYTELHLMNRQNLVKLKNLQP